MRIKFSPGVLAELKRIDRPVVFALWHNRLMVAAELFRQHRRAREVVALISSSKDGAWLEAFFEEVGIRAARGSSSRRGHQATVELIEALKAGHDVGITPDGPRGPCYRMKEGGLVIARRAGAPVVLLGAVFEEGWRLKSWDRFWVPKPFSRVGVSYEVLDAAALVDDGLTVERVQAKLNRLNLEPETGGRDGVVI